MTVPLRFYMDHHVHGAITAGVRRRGINSLTLHEDGTSRLDDEVVLERATQLGRVLVSQDLDLFIIASHWIQIDREFGGLVYIRPLSVTIGQAITDLELIAHAISEEEAKNSIQYIPL